MLVVFALGWMVGAAHTAELCISVGFRFLEELDIEIPQDVVRSLLARYGL